MGSDKEVAPEYGEGDIEAKAMSEAASAPAGTHGKAPPTGPVGPSAGTTETDVAANIHEKVNRSSKN